MIAENNRLQAKWNFKSEESNINLHPLPIQNRHTKWSRRQGAHIHTPSPKLIPRLTPILLTATPLNVLIAGPNVPCCPTGTFTSTIGAALLFPSRDEADLVATVKFNVVIVAEVLEVRDETTKAAVCTGKLTFAPPWPRTWKEVSESAEEMGTVNG